MSPDRGPVTGEVDVPARNTLADGLVGIGRSAPRADGDERSDRVADRDHRRAHRANVQRPVILGVLMAAAGIVVAIAVTRGHG